MAGPRYIGGGGGGGWGGGGCEAGGDWRSMRSNRRRYSCIEAWYDGGGGRSVISGYNIAVKTKTDFKFHQNMKFMK